MARPTAQELVERKEKELAEYKAKLVANDHKLIAAIDAKIEAKNAATRKNEAAILALEEDKAEILKRLSNGSVDNA